MKKFLVLVTLIGIKFGYCQTKLIAHKGHSGTNNTFHLVIDEITKSDFGLPSNYHLKDTIYDIEKLIKKITKVDTLKKDSILVEKVILNKDSSELKSSKKNEKLQALEKNKSENEKETIPVFKANNHQPPFDNKMIYIILIGLISIIIGTIYKVLQSKTI